MNKKTQGSARAWSDPTTSCIVQAKVEKAPGYGVLGRYTACSTERIEVLSTRSNAIILYGTLPAYCTSKAIVMKFEEIIFQKVYVSPRPPPTISYKHNWMCDLDSDVAGSSKDNQRIQTTPNYQVREDPWVDRNPPMRSRKISCLVTRTSSTQQERRDP